LCSKLLQKDPTKRLGSGETDADEIMSHPWFAPIDWQKISAKVLAPPYKPQLDRPDDVKHFPPEFTGIQPTAADLEHVKGGSETSFPNFSYDQEGGMLGDHMMMSQK
jgi:serine/threonine protein kinase